jgi:hypothetical protein
VGIEAGGGRNAGVGYRYADQAQARGVGSEPCQNVSEGGARTCLTLSSALWGRSRGSTHAGKERERL